MNRSQYVVRQIDKTDHAIIGILAEDGRITGKDCFVARVIVNDMQVLEALVDRFGPFSATETAIVQSSPVSMRLPRL